MKISKEGKGRYTGIIFVGRLCRTLKYEEVNLKANATEAPKELGVYLRFYNDQRLHQALGYSTPAVVFYDDSPLRNEAPKGRRCSPDPLLESWQERQDSHLTRPHQLGYLRTPAFGSARF